MNSEGTIFIVILAIIGLLLLRMYLRRVRNDKNKALYEQALKSGNKQAALAAGRTYYAGLRGGRLTIYDEQALANDLAVMETNKTA